MSYYSREEQETIYNYDSVNDVWIAYSTYPPHIRRLLKRGSDVKTDKDKEGRVIEVTAKLKSHQVRLYK